MKNPHFSFRLDAKSEEDYIKKIRNCTNLGFDNQSELIRTAVISYLDGTNANDIKSQIEKERLQQLKNKNDLHYLVREEKELANQIKKKILNYENNFGSMPSTQAQNAIKNYFEKPTAELTADEKLFSNFSEIEKIFGGELAIVCKYCDIAVFAQSLKSLAYEARRHLQINHKGIVV